MTKQEIIDDMTKNIILDFENGALAGFHIEDERFADTLLARFEKEKKEQVKEIFEKLYPCISRGATTYTIWAKDIEEIAKEYGVEL